MKKSFPNYASLVKRDKKGEAVSFMKKIEATLSPKNKKVIEDFLEYCKMTSNSQIAMYQKKKIMLQIYDIIEKPLSSITLKELRDFLVVINTSSLSPSTQNDIKAIFKRFLVW